MSATLLPRTCPVCGSTASRTEPKPQLSDEQWDLIAGFFPEYVPNPSNAVERGNRRHRKMQKSVYRVRTQTSIQRRMALDLQRDQQAAGRAATTKSLHKARKAA